MNDGFFTPSQTCIPQQKSTAEMVVFQKTLLFNYIAYLDSPELSGSDKHARKWKDKMLKEIKAINQYLKMEEKSIHQGQEHWI